MYDCKRFISTPQQQALLRALEEEAKRKDPIVEFCSGLYNKCCHWARTKKEGESPAEGVSLLLATRTATYGGGK